MYHAARAAKLPPPSDGMEAAPTGDPCGQTTSGTETARDSVAKTISIVMKPSMFSTSSST